MIKVGVRHVENGCVIEIADEASEATLVYQEQYETDDSVEAFALLLQELDERFGPKSDRYSPKRIYIRVEPGDKFEDKYQP